MIFAANHIGVIDGPLLAIFAPAAGARADQAGDVPRARSAGSCARSGQIPLDRFHTDPRRGEDLPARAARRATRSASSPRAAAARGDLDRFHRGAAYLALVTGAPVVPGDACSAPASPAATATRCRARGGAVDLVFGAPSTLDAAPWPRTREQVEQASVLLREHMLVHLDRARASTGRDLPGPLPADEVEPDPATGVTEQGAP